MDSAIFKAERLKCVKRLNDLNDHTLDTIAIDKSMDTTDESGQESEIFTEDGETENDDEETETENVILALIERARVDGVPAREYLALALLIAFVAAATPAADGAGRRRGSEGAGAARRRGWRRAGRLGEAPGAPE